jgi:hypothetical protein
MDKMKLIFTANVVVIIVLIVVMFSLKGKYRDQAQLVVKETTEAYIAEVNKTLYAQGQFVDEWNMVWELVFESANKKSLNPKTLESMISAIESNYLKNPKNLEKLEKWGLKELKMRVEAEANLRNVYLGDDKVVVFDFAGNKLKSINYDALIAYSPSEKFKINEPAPFNFNSKIEGAK